MKKLILGALVALASGMLAAPAVYAADEAGAKMTKEEWKAMTPEQKAEKKAAAKARYDAMTPEQQAAAKKHFSEKHPKAAAEMEKKKAAEAAPK